MSISHPVYMIGHSKHPWSRFLDLLGQHAITLLIDVRSSPQSRFSPQFNAKAMKAGLGSISYRHFAELGGRNPLPIDKLREHVATLLPPQEHICMVCSEGNFLECHRHYLLAPLVIELGYQVHQITPTGALVVDSGPTPATLRKMAEFLPKSAPAQSTLFDAKGVLKKP